MIEIIPRKAARNRWSSNIICFLLTTHGLFIGIYRAARAGRLLPTLTLMIPIHIVAHFTFFCLRSADFDIISADPTRATEKTYFRRISFYIMMINLFLNAIGYIFLVQMFQHSVQIIFNRNIPRRTTDESGRMMLVSHPALEAFNTHLLLLRPLEIMFRFITAPLRVLPDVIILGETRCGTTNLCGHIVNLTSISYQSTDREKIKVYTPFCAWNVPELDHKETFYFVGHYLGIVDPYFYRMAFPLKITRWWEEQVLGNIFICFDGCAQYLSSPTAPYLIASAFRNLPSPVLVACIRKPVDQAVSWWQYENNSMAWGESMGLKEWNTALRSKIYPPKTITEAISFSKSEFVQNAYSNAETLGIHYLEQQCDEKYSIAHKYLPNLSLSRIKRLPSWSITWPAGQLSIIGRSGKYAENINRYNKIFSNTNMSAISLDNKFGAIHIVPIEYQSDGKVLRTVIRPFLSDIAINCAKRRKLAYMSIMSRMDAAINKLCDGQSVQLAHHRNSSPIQSHFHFGPSDEDLTVLHHHFAQETESYNSVFRVKETETRDKQRG